jgi:hypothetical protein
MKREDEQASVCFLNKNIYINGCYDFVKNVPKRMNVDAITALAKNLYDDWTLYLDQLI